MTPDGPAMLEKDQRVQPPVEPSAPLLHAATQDHSTAAPVWTGSSRTLCLKLFGPPGLVFEGEPVRLSPGATLLCAYLALAPKEGRPRSVAAAHLFPDSCERLARRRLNTALWRLRGEVRAATGLEIVATESCRTVALSSDVDVTTDAASFETLVEPALCVEPADLDEADVARLHRAVALRTGQLVETCDDDWLLAGRHRLDNLCLTALAHLVQYHGARRDVRAVTEFGERALELEPLREDLHRHLIRAYGTAGRIDLAERQFERCRSVLLAELGTDPLPETVAAYTRLRSGATGRAAAADVSELIGELERARRDVGRLAAVVDRALAQLRRMS